MPDGRQIRIGVQVQPQQGTFKSMRDAWLRAEEMGADTVFTWDHFFPLTGDPDGPPLDIGTKPGLMERQTITDRTSCPPAPASIRPSTRC